MNSQRQAVFGKLNELGISYELIVHPAAYTVEQMDSLDVGRKDEIPKNLFLRDDKKKRYILLVLVKDKQVNLKELSRKIDSRPLGFASEEALNTHLGLGKGSVTPLGILNDESRSVEVLIDKSLLSYKSIGVHPNDNTATVFITLHDLERVLTDHGNKFEYIEI
jgi:Ala-tRNA(Pro) deacylase